MSNNAPQTISWLDVPEEKNYPAAESFLSLILGPKRAAKLVADLRSAPLAKFEAKDILRAAQLTMLDVKNTQVKKNVRKIEEGTPLSPILLVRDRRNRRVIVADGFHRLCAVYSTDEDAEIPCRIV